MRCAPASSAVHRAGHGQVGLAVPPGPIAEGDLVHQQWRRVSISFGMRLGMTPLARVPAPPVLRPAHASVRSSTATATALASSPCGAAFGRRFACLLVRRIEQQHGTVDGTTRPVDQNSPGAAPAHAGRPRWPAHGVQRHHPPEPGGGCRRPRGVATRCAGYGNCARPRMAGAGAARCSIADHALPRLLALFHSTSSWCRRWPWPAVRLRRSRWTCGAGRSRPPAAASSSLPMPAELEVRRCPTRSARTRPVSPARCGLRIRFGLDRARQPTTCWRCSSSVSPATWKSCSTASSSADGRLHVRAGLLQPAREPARLFRRIVGGLGPDGHPAVGARRAGRPLRGRRAVGRHDALHGLGGGAVPAALCRRARQAGRRADAAAVRTAAVVADRAAPSTSVRWRWAGTRAGTASGRRRAVYLRQERRRLIRGGWPRCSRR